MRHIILAIFLALFIHPSISYSQLAVNGYRDAYIFPSSEAVNPARPVAPQYSRLDHDCSSRDRDGNSLSTCTNSFSPYFVHQRMSVRLVGFSPKVDANYVRNSPNTQTRNHSDFWLGWTHVPGVYERSSFFHPRPTPYTQVNREGGVNQNYRYRNHSYRIWGFNNATCDFDINRRATVTSPPRQVPHFEYVVPGGKDPNQGNGLRDFTAKFASSALNADRVSFRVIFGGISRDEPEIFGGVPPNEHPWRPLNTTNCLTVDQSDRNIRPTLETIVSTDTIREVRRYGNARPVIPSSHGQRTSRIRQSTLNNPGGLHLFSSSYHNFAEWIVTFNRPVSGIAGQEEALHERLGGVRDTTHELFRTNAFNIELISDVGHHRNLQDDLQDRMRVVPFDASCRTVPNFGINQRLSADVGANISCRRWVVFVDYGGVQGRFAPRSTFNLRVAPDHRIRTAYPSNFLGFSPLLFGYGQTSSRVSLPHYLWSRNDRESSTVDESNPIKMIEVRRSTGTPSIIAPAGNAQFIERDLDWIVTFNRPVLQSSIGNADFKLAVADDPQDLLASLASDVRTESSYSITAIALDDSNGDAPNIRFSRRYRIRATVKLPDGTNDIELRYSRQANLEGIDLSKDTENLRVSHLASSFSPANYRIPNLDFPTVSLCSNTCADADTDRPSLTSIEKLATNTSSEVYPTNLLFEVEFNEPVEGLDSGVLQATFTGTPTIDADDIQYSVFPLTPLGVVDSSLAFSARWQVQVNVERLVDPTHSEYSQVMNYTDISLSLQDISKIVDSSGNALNAVSVNSESYVLARTASDEHLGGISILDSTTVGSETYTTGVVRTEDSVEITILFDYPMDRLSFQTADFALFNVGRITSSEHSVLSDGNHLFRMNAEVEDAAIDDVSVHIAPTSDSQSIIVSPFDASPAQHLENFTFFPNPDHPNYHDVSGYLIGSIIADSTRVSTPRVMQIEVSGVMNGRFALLSNRMIEWQVTFTHDVSNVDAADVLVQNVLGEEITGATIVHTASTTVDNLHTFAVTLPDDTLSGLYSLELSASHDIGITQDDNGTSVFVPLSSLTPFATSSLHHGEIYIDTESPYLFRFEELRSDSRRNSSDRHVWVIEFSEPVRFAAPSVAQTRGVTADTITLIKDGSDVDASDLASSDIQELSISTNDRNGRIYRISVGVSDTFVGDLGLRVDIEHLVDLTGTSLLTAASDIPAGITHDATNDTLTTTSISIGSPVEIIGITARSSDGELRTTANKKVTVSGQDDVSRSVDVRDITRGDTITLRLWSDGQLEEPFTIRHYDKGSDSPNVYSSVSMSCINSCSQQTFDFLGVAQTDVYIYEGDVTIPTSGSISLGYPIISLEDPIYDSSHNNLGSAENRLELSTIVIYENIAARVEPFTLVSVNAEPSGSTTDGVDGSSGREDVHIDHVIDWLYTFSDDVANLERSDFTTTVTNPDGTPYDFSSITATTNRADSVWNVNCSTNTCLVSVNLENMPESTIDPSDGTVTPNPAGDYNVSLSFSSSSNVRREGVSIAEAVAIKAGLASSNSSYDRLSNLILSGTAVSGPSYSVRNSDYDPEDIQGSANDTEFSVVARISTDDVAQSSECLIYNIDCAAPPSSAPSADSGTNSQEFTQTGPQDFGASANGRGSFLSGRPLTPPRKIGISGLDVGSVVRVRITANHSMGSPPRQILINRRVNPNNGWWDTRGRSKTYVYSFRVTPTFPERDGPLDILIRDYDIPNSLRNETSKIRFNTNADFGIFRTLQLNRVRRVCRRCRNEVVEERLAASPGIQASPAANPATTPAAVIEDDDVPRIVDPHESGVLSWLINFNRPIASIGREDFVPQIASGERPSVGESIVDSLSTTDELERINNVLAQIIARNKERADRIARARAERERARLLAASRSSSRCRNYVCSTDTRKSPSVQFSPQSSPQAPQANEASAPLTNDFANLFDQPDFMMPDEIEGYQPLSEEYTITIVPMSDDNTVFEVQLQMVDPLALPHGSAVRLSLSPFQTLQDPNGQLASMPSEVSFSPIFVSFAGPVSPGAPMLDGVAEAINDTNALVDSFIESRYQSIVNNIPNLGSRLTRGVHGGFARSNNFAANVDNNSSEVDYDASFAFDSSIFGLSPSQGASGASSLEGWAEIKYSSGEYNDTKSTGFYLTGGIDYLASEDIVIGLFAEYDMSEHEATLTAPMEIVDAYSSSITSTTQVLTSNIEGTGWLLGPYIAVELSNNLVVNGLLTYGASSNDVNPYGVYTDEVESERILVKAGLSKVGVASIGSWSLTPSIDYILYNEEVDGYRDGARDPGNTNIPAEGNEIPSISFDVNRLDFGPEFSKSRKLSDGSQLDTRFGIRGVWESAESLSNTILTTQDDLTARINLDFYYTGTSGIGMNFGGYYGGLGDTNSNYGITLGVDIRY